MTVKELIDILQEYPQDLEVWSLDIFGNDAVVESANVFIEGKGESKHVIIYGE